MQNQQIKVTSFTGEAIHNLIPQIAELRIEVFAEYPFFYDGDYGLEMGYLKKFFTMLDGIVVAAFDGDELIGVSTGYPFVYSEESFKELFRSVDRNPNEYFCFGESVLRKSYRGQGIGRQFFEHLEEHVERLKAFRYICFYTSPRPADDPKRPADYRPLAPFWKRRGFVEHPELIGITTYKEIGETEESPKEMIFWIKELQATTERDD